MNNYRNKRITIGTRQKTQNQINQLRNTRIKNAKSQMEIRFLKSASFDKEVNRQVKLNRSKSNQNKLNFIASKLGATTEQKVSIRKIFGEKISTNSNGKTVKRNSFTSKSQTDKLNKAIRQIKKNIFSINRRVAQLDQFKKVRKYLPKNPSQNEILEALNRTGFYYENKTYIDAHNRNVIKMGYYLAQRESEGRKLSNKYNENLDNEDIDLINSLLK